MQLLAKLNHLFKDNEIDEESNYYIIRMIIDKGYDGHNHWLRCYLPRLVDIYNKLDPTRLKDDSNDAQIEYYKTLSDIIIDLGTENEVKIFKRHIIRSNDQVKIKKLDDWCDQMYNGHIQITSRELVKNRYGKTQFFTLDVKRDFSEEDLTLVYLIAGELL